VVIRPNDGFNNPDNNVLTPHISFDAFDTSGDNVTILASFDEIARTIEELNQMWNTSYSDLETVETKNII